MCILWDTSAFKGLHAPNRSLTYLNRKMAIDDQINPSYHKYYVIVMLLYHFQVYFPRLKRNSPLPKLNTQRLKVTFPLSKLKIPETKLGFQDISFNFPSIMIDFPKLKINI